MVSVSQARTSMGFAALKTEAPILCMISSIITMDFVRLDSKLYGLQHSRLGHKQIKHNKTEAPWLFKVIICQLEASHSIFINVQHTTRFDTFLRV